MIIVGLEKPNCTQDPLVTNVGLSWRLFPFILFNVTVVRAAKQLHITSLPPQPLTDFIVFLELMASPFHLQIYHWSMWPNWGTYRKTDAMQTLTFRKQDTNTAAAAGTCLRMEPCRINILKSLLSYLWQKLKITIAQLTLECYCQWTVKINLSSKINMSRAQLFVVGAHSDEP